MTDDDGGGPECHRCGSDAWREVDDGALQCGACGFRPRRARRQYIREEHPDYGGEP